MINQSFHYIGTFYSIMMTIRTYLKLISFYSTLHANIMLKNSTRLLNIYFKNFRYVLSVYISFKVILFSIPVTKDQ